MTSYDSHSCRKAKRAAQEEAAGQEKVLHHLFPEEMLEMREMPGPPTIQ